MATDKGEELVREGAARLRELAARRKAELAERLASVGRLERPVSSLDSVEKWAREHVAERGGRWVNPEDSE